MNSPFAERVSLKIKFLLCNFILLIGVTVGRPHLLKSLAVYWRRRRHGDADPTKRTLPINCETLKLEANVNLCLCGCPQCLPWQNILISPLAAAASCRCGRHTRVKRQIRIQMKAHVATTRARSLFLSNGGYFS